MKREDIFSVLSLIVIIIILILIAGYVANKLFGKEGVIDQYKEADIEYNKAEIVEKLNLAIKEKYVLDYKYAQENKKNIDEIYTAETAFNFLLEQKYLEPLRDVDNDVVENQYYVNADALNSDIATYVINKNGSESNGTKIFKVKKVDDKYIISFIDKYGTEEDLGELILKPEV